MLCHKLVCKSQQQLYEKFLLKQRIFMSHERACQQRYGKAMSEKLPVKKLMIISVFEEDYGQCKEVQKHPTRGN